MSDLHEERSCPACRGSGVGRRIYDGCDHCDGSGSVVTCLGCGHDVAAPEAETEGAYCSPCRKALDIPEAAE